MDSLVLTDDRCSNGFFLCSTFLPASEADFLQWLLKNKDRNKNVGTKFRAHDAFLESPFIGYLNAKSLEIQMILNNLWEQENQRA